MFFQTKPAYGLHNNSQYELTKTERFIGFKKKSIDLFWFYFSLWTNYDVNLFL